MSKKHGYALFSSSRNRFLLVHDDYEMLKYVQLIVMNYELLYLVDLSGIVNNLPGIVRDDRCMNLTISNGHKMRIEIDMYFTNPSYRLIPVGPPTQDDIRCKEILSFILTFLIASKNTSDKIMRRDLQQVEGLKKGLRVFKKFMKMVVPGDEQLQSLIDREIANKDIPKDILNEFQGILFQTLHRADYSQSLDDLKRSINDSLTAVPIRAYYFKESITEARKLLS